MRNAKEGTVRKNEIMDIALALFLEKGYEKTTIEDILTKTGISKGTFYYYFEAKEDVLKILAWREAERKLELTRRIAEDECHTALDKLNKIITGAQQINFADFKHRIEIFKAVNEYGNLEFQQRIYDHSLRLGVPLIQSILEQGNVEKTMKVQYPQEMAELFIVMMNHFKAAIGKLWLELQDKTAMKSYITQKAGFYQDFLAKNLGVEAGQLSFLAATLKYIDEI